MTPFSRLFWRSLHEGTTAIHHDFSARAVVGRDGEDVLIVSGELDAATAPRLLQATEAWPRPNTPLTLDLEAVTFMDLAGLTALETIGVLAQAVDGPIFLRRPSRAVRYLLEFRRRFTTHEPWTVETEGITV